MSSESESDHSSSEEEKVVETKKRATKEKKEPAPKKSKTASGKAKAEKPAKKGKKEKDPNAPKRNISAYFFFMKDQRPEFVKNHPHAQAKEIARLLGEAWKSVDPDDKKKYEAQAADDKIRYEAEKEKYFAENPHLAPAPKEKKKPAPKKKAAPAPVVAAESDDESDGADEDD